MAVELDPRAQKLLDEVDQAFRSAERHSKDIRDGWERRYAQYRSYQDFRRSLGQAGPRDRDAVMRDGQQTFGADLHIPYSYQVIETILPRMLSNRPRMQVFPRNKASEQNVQHMKWLIDSQQDAIRYELVLQDTAKSGLIYGLGIQKTDWRREEAVGKKVEPGVFLPYVEKQYAYCPYDDPTAEDIDIFDFFWDPYGSDLIPHSAGCCRWVIHRTWRDTKYVLDKINRKVWTGVRAEDAQSMGSSQKYDESVGRRFKAAGMPDFSAKDSNLHEVWEFHDKSRVCVVLDRQVPVLAAKNPAWHGNLPFHAFRPNSASVKQLPGIGEIEPIEHLQRELDTLRSQRRDNATLKLNMPMAYADGLIDPNDMQVFPGAAWPVAGEPRDLLFPVQMGDIPNSGYQEEQALLADFERTTGISDPVQGTAEAQTATGTQLAQAAANVRIQAKTRRLEVEVIKGVTSQFGALNQQRIRENREVRIPAPPEPGQPERRWAWVEFGPGEIAGEFDYEPEGGSTAPENVPQMRQDGQLIMQMFGANPQVDTRKVLEHSLRLFGVKDPESWMAPDQRIPPVFIDILNSMLMQGGVQQAQEIIAAALQQAQLAEQQQAMASPNAVQDQGVAEQQAAQEAEGGQQQSQPEQQPSPAQNGAPAY